MKQRSRIFKIKGALQYYDWGKIGNESLVAQLYNQDTGSLILPNKPYAGEEVGNKSFTKIYLVLFHSNDYFLFCRALVWYSSEWTLTHLVWWWTYWIVTWTHSKRSTKYSWKRSSTLLEQHSAISLQGLSLFIVYFS